ncbi:single-stranded-DNA-specific exonuclease RecJ [Vagococcus elongatus]|uniref:Single-stranded-DNA-specific exonuclease RecJ n=1 Tax=Vagococcus elongatus TaxID=180344 RepID=A0A430B5W8_9ENTE|nr:single-stranded-DNA-specific exonuclease RecJ [Vagococcus elongatus]RSU15687.1 single-stranded-DNA-specific exonuclease RecJ [Vagococcus elongatus]
MRKSHFHWTTTEVEIPPEVVNWLEKNNISSFLGELLAKRNITTEEQLAGFFNPSLEELHDPFLLFDMEKAIERLRGGIASGEKIVIYGDYDADGITSVTVLKEAIELVGGEVTVYLPNRFTDGYGPNLDVYKHLIEEGAELIVTVDNGVTGHDAVDYANAMGVDVIITDHHELPDSLPEAYAVIHPRHPKGKYPFGELAGVGVAFKVASALLEEVPEELLDLVAIGTIADLVSLTGENRVLVKLGIEYMGQTHRLGIQALCQVAGIDISSVSSQTIGFGIGPRLNAIGRLGDATPGVQLLSTFDQKEAEDIAQDIQKKNEQRQKIVADIKKEAMAMVKDSEPKNIYILAKEGWHEGVLGIVASHIVQATNRPAIILSIDSSTGIAKGSGRSIEAINLFELLQNVEEHLEKFGGHHMAAGLSLQTTHLEQVRQLLNERIFNMAIDFSIGSPLPVEDSLSINNISESLIEDLQLLEPFGTDNPSPYFLFKDVGIKETRKIGADKKHLKLVLESSGQTLDTIGFGFGDEADEFETAEELSVVGTIGLNVWNGIKKPQLLLKDFQVLGNQLFDYREQLHRLEELSQLEDVLYVLFNERNRRVFSNLSEDKIFSFEELTNGKMALTSTYRSLVLLDCPNTVAQARTVVQEYQAERLYLLLYSSEKCYLNGLPSREQFAKLFKLIQQEKELDVRHKTSLIANHLNIEESLIIFMIQVFFDLEFVTIEDGVLRKKEVMHSMSLNESKIYQLREQKVLTEKLLLYGSMTDVEKHLF